MLPFVAAVHAAEPPAATIQAPVAAVLQAPAKTPTDGYLAVPFKFALVPGVGWAAGPQVPVEGAVMGVLSMSPAVSGVDAEIAMSWVDGPMDGLQMAVGATVADDLHGIQLSSGLAWARGDVHMAQLSAGAAVAFGDLWGLQTAAGVVVTGGTMRGLQAAPVVIANDVEGAQMGLLNVGDQVEGLQLGLLNVGRDVDGVQFGLVNVARTSKVSIAPLNFIGDGLHRVDVWASESSVGSVALKFGSRHVYTLIGAGWVNPKQPWWTFGAGLGVHLPAGPAWVEIDDTVWSLAAGNVIVPGLHNKLRAQVGVDLVKGHLAPFAGVSVNTWYGLGDVAPKAVGLPEYADSTRQWVAWPGVHAGVSF